MMMMNRARKDPIWSEIVVSLKPILGTTTELVFPKTWSQKYLSWYREIEQSSFRASLTYSEEEILERLEMNDVLMMFVLVNGRPECLILGYALDGVSVETFYLDTIAVREKGRGIGRIIISVLIKWAKKMRYQQMQLDTELEDEKGIKLTKFYENFGFTIIDSDETIDNITMQLDL
jgi:GNAT superfamily N-acetyltransferase